MLPFNADNGLKGSIEQVLLIQSSGYLYTRFKKTHGEGKKVMNFPVIKIYYFLIKIDKLSSKTTS